MIFLVSKVQFKRSEKGEFHNILKRNLDETINLLLNYPWNVERHLASVELSCPCITIEHPIGTFLKVGPYFSGKFSLYFLDSTNKVRIKVVENLEDVTTYIKAYFKQEGEISGFEHYGYRFNAISHFRTNPFIYTVNFKAKLCFFEFPIIMTVFCLVFGGLIFLATGNLIFMGVSLLVMLFFTTPLFFFFFNYSSADKQYYLKLSKGHDEFIYGTHHHKKTYNKDNITSIEAYGVQNTKSPWSECEIFIITFNNGEKLRFTSLLISGTKLRGKFPDNKVLDIYKSFPLA